MYPYLPSHLRFAGCTSKLPVQRGIRDAGKSEAIGWSQQKPLKIENLHFFHICLPSGNLT